MMTHDIKDNAKLKEIIKVATTVSASAKMISQECNLGLNYAVLQTATGLMNTGISFAKTLNEGSQASTVSTNIRPAFQYCFRNANLAPISNIFISQGGYYAINSLNTGTNIGKQYQLQVGMITNFNGKYYISTCFRDYNKSSLLINVAKYIEPSVTLTDGYNNFYLGAGYMYSWVDNTGASPYYQICISDKGAGSV